MLKNIIENGMGEFFCDFMVNGCPGVLDFKDVSDFTTTCSILWRGAIQMSVKPAVANTVIRILINYGIKSNSFIRDKVKESALRSLCR